jgi:hypothetical protein
MSAQFLGYSCNLKKKLSKVSKSPNLVTLDSSENGEKEIGLLSRRRVYLYAFPHFADNYECR